MLITLSHIHKIFTTGEVAVHALDDLNIEIEQGEFVAIIGQSGSGKTTLLDILGCLSQPTSGDYWLHGAHINTLPDSELTTIRNRQIGFIFQTFHLLPRKTAMENVQLPLMYAEIGKRHPGFDCFVFNSGLLDELELRALLIGTPRVGAGMLCNLACRARSFALLRDHHLTFHIGEDQVWLRPELEDYAAHNTGELLRILESWEESGMLEARPLVQRVLARAREAASPTLAGSLRRFVGSRKNRALGWLRSVVGEGA